MDPVTHAALGIAAAETILGKKAPGRAALAGLLAGIMPDFDLFPAMMSGPLERLSIHRGFTHSIIFALIMAPILGYLFSRRSGDTSKPGPGSWSFLIFAAIMSHIIIDCFTTYGTMVFFPFSHYRVAFSTISIVDLIFTIPLIVAISGFLLTRKNIRLGRAILFAGMTVSAVYLTGMILVKQHVETVFENELNRQGAAHTRIFTTPTILAGFLWVGTAEGDRVYYTASHSIFDRGTSINFSTVKKNHDLIEYIKEEEPIKKLIWFTDGLYSIEPGEGSLVLNDLRYGTFFSVTGKGRPLNSFIISTGKPIRITTRHRHPINRDVLAALLRRMSGEKYRI